MPRSSDLFTVEEQRAVATQMAGLVRPLCLRILVLGRVALFYRYNLMGISKDVDLHPFPLAEVDPLALHDVLDAAVTPSGGHIKWMEDGRGLLVYYPLHDRIVPVELIFGGEDWIQEDVLEDAIRKGEEMGGVVVPSDEHLFVMKAEAYVDRKDRAAADKYFNDLVQIVDALGKEGGALDRVEVSRLIRMRPVRKHHAMFDVCNSIIPEPDGQ